MKVAQTLREGARDAGEFRWTSTSRSHPGRVREVNEDAFLDQPRQGLWVVADGMGGHSLGEFASRVAARSLADLPAADTLEQRVAAARERLQEVNRRLRAEAARRDLSIIGTTVAVLLAAQGRCTCLWAGDSRIYRYRAGRLTQLTRDHSQLVAMQSRRIATTDDTLDRPPANMITRALGAEDTIQLDAVTVEVDDGDTFLLCSDGLSNEVSALDIEHALLRSGNCRLACEALLDLALERGGHDNITAVVVRAEDLVSPDRTAMRAAL